MVNGIGYVISKEGDLASGPRTRLDHSRAFVQPSFIKIRQGTDKASDIDIRRGTESAPHTSLSKRSYILFTLIITINQKNVSKL